MVPASFDRSTDLPPYSTGACASPVPLPEVGDNLPCYRLIIRSLFRDRNCSGTKVRTSRRCRYQGIGLVGAQERTFMKSNVTRDSLQCSSPVNRPCTRRGEARGRERPPQYTLDA